MRRLQFATHMTPREVDLQSQLDKRDAQVAELTRQVAELRQAIAGQGLVRMTKPKPFSSMLPGGTGGAPIGGLRATSPRPSARAQSPRPGGDRLQSPRAQNLHPGSPRGADTGTAFGSTTSTARRSSPNSFFHASMRGGPLTDPLPHRGPTPLGAVKGPSLLTRDRFGAKRSEWERFKLNADGRRAGAGGHESFFEDDNPFNDPFQYRPFKGLAFPPSNYVGPDDPRETDDLGELTPNSLRLAFVYGYCGRRARNNLFYNADGALVYHTAALGVVYDKDAHEQMHFRMRLKTLSCLLAVLKDQRSRTRVA